MNVYDLCGTSGLFAKFRLNRDNTRLHCSRWTRGTAQRGNVKAYGKLSRQPGLERVQRVRDRNAKILPTVPELKQPLSIAEAEKITEEMINSFSTNRMMKELIESASLFAGAENIGGARTMQMHFRSDFERMHEDEMARRDSQNLSPTQMPRPLNKSSYPPPYQPVPSPHHAMTSPYHLPRPSPHQFHSVPSPSRVQYQGGSYPHQSMSGGQPQYHPHQPVGSALPEYHRVPSPNHPVHRSPYNGGQPVYHGVPSPSHPVRRSPYNGGQPEYHRVPSPHHPVRASPYNGGQPEYHRVPTPHHPVRGSPYNDHGVASSLPHNGCQPEYHRVPSPHHPVRGSPYNQGVGAPHYSVLESPHHEGPFGAVPSPHQSVRKSPFHGGDNSGYPSRNFKANPPASRKRLRSSTGSSQPYSVSSDESFSGSESLHSSDSDFEGEESSDDLRDFIDFDPKFNRTRISKRQKGPRGGDELNHFLFEHQAQPRKWFKRLTQTTVGAKLAKQY